MFKKAQRTQAKLKLALTGPSGAGKTYSALRLAKGMGKRIAVVDTENGSASLYADRFEFDTLTIAPPYEVRKYNEAIRAAVAAGYDVLIIDSLTHAWAGEGGLLAKKESLDARGGNSFTNWASITKEHEAFKGLLLNSDIHIIGTMRSKQEYLVEQNERGKSVPKKVGLAPIQRDGMEYEFTTVFDVAINHEAQVSKDRTSLFDGKVFQITEETGIALMKWLAGAKPQDVPAPAAQIDNAAKTGRVVDPAPGQTKVTEAVPPKDAGISCQLCAAPVELHASGNGYTCPNWKERGDGHTRFAASLLEKYRSKQQPERNDSNGTVGNA